MTKEKNESTNTLTEELLNHYGFELGGVSAENLIGEWVKKYPPLWVRLAVVEALYQGRYKAVSVEQILTFWSRKGEPIFHFNHEFERLICRKLPRYLGSISYYKYQKKENNKKIVFSEGKIKEIKDISEEEKVEIIPVNKSIVQDNTKYFQEKKGELVLVSKSFNPSPIDKFKPHSDESNLYVKLREALIAINN